MTKIRLFLITLTLAVVGIGGYFSVLYARGYRFDAKSFRFTPNGILVIKSDPDSASVFINGELATATNATIPLAPGKYDVTVKKDGYFDWNKRLTIEKEVVTGADVSLFRALPSLSPLTFSGAVDPQMSPTSTRIVYLVPKDGLWALETVNLPLGFAKEPKRVTDGDLTGATWIFSPSGREILVSYRESVFLFDTTVFIPQNERVNVASRSQSILSSWKLEEKAKLDAQIKNLPEALKEILTNKVSQIVFSPDETKILYTASSEAKLSDNLIRQLPGSSTQKQERGIKPDRTYVYDIKEDRNFLIEDNSSRRLAWFPTSSHLVLAEEGKITIMDYDGTNRVLVYSGSYIAPHAYPFATTNKLLILTNLGADSSSANLYSLSLK